MKRKPLLLLWVLSLMVSAVSAQQITLNKKQANILDLVKEIKKQSGYDFVFPQQLLRQAKPVTIAVRQQPIETVLKICFDGQPFTYRIEDKLIIVEPLKDRPARNGAATDPGARVPRMSMAGRLVDSLGNPIPGATVRLVRAPVVGGPGADARAAISGRDGFFSFGDVEAGAVLRITHMSYEPLDITASPDLGVLTLRAKSSALEEVQVIGYGTTSRRLSTGNVASVKAEAIENQPVSNPLLALQGRVAGLSVIQPSGLAGGGVRVRVQGQNSIANGTLPLYVVDGVPIVSELPPTAIDHVLGATGPRFAGFSNPLNYLNPADIESIDVLKDADATAIYGSLAANGAILITTKKGKAGAMQLDIDTETGFGQVASRVDMLDTRQYLDMRYEAFRNDGIDWRDPRVAADDLKVWDTTRYTDWQKELIGGTARYATTNASVSGGTNTVQYRIGAAQQYQNTVFPIPDDFADRKVSVSSNLTASSLDKRFTLQFTGNYMSNQNTLPGFDLTQPALLLEPNAPSLYNADGSINWAPNGAGGSTFFSNPLRRVLTRYRNDTQNLIGNLVLGAKLYKGLEVQVNLGYNRLATDDFRAQPLAVNTPEDRLASLASADFGNRLVWSWIVEPQLRYHRTVAGGRLEALLGTTLRDAKSRTGALKGEGYLSDDQLENIDAAATVSSQNASRTHYRYHAVFGRINYAWRDRYVLNLTARRDGSSRFGDANRFGNFGAVGAAWIFTEETFLPDWPMLSFGKLRGSYGLVGSDQIGDYRYLSLYDFVNVPLAYQGVVGILPSSLPNPNIQWEETRKLQLGLDVGLLRDRILVTAAYARNRSSNQLLGYALPSMVGRTTLTGNFPATVQNVNWELSVSSDNITRGRFRWSTTLNMTLPDNRLLAFPNLAESSYANQLVIGEPVFVLREYRFAFVDPATGRYHFFNSEGRTTASPRSATDRLAYLHTQEDFYGGLGNTLTWRSFSLDVLLQFVKQLGYDGLDFGSDAKRSPGSFYNGLSNQPVTVLRRWQRPGDEAPVARFTTQNDLGGTVLQSDYRFVDASFIRLKNVALAYVLPDHWVRHARLRRCRLYANAQNLFTLTGYRGLDPESQSIVSLPPLRVVTVGIQLAI